MIALAILALFVGILALVFGFGWFIQSLTDPDMGPGLSAVGYVASAFCFTVAYLLVVFAVHRIH